MKKKKEFNFGKCMLRKCGQCRYEQNCLREDVEYENSLQENRGINAIRKESKKK